MRNRRKKIKFPLEMKDGQKVRELDEFREHFDLEKAVEYFCSGKLQAWLSNLYASDIVEELEELSGEENDFAEKFTEALGVNCTEQLDVRRIIHISRLKEKLKRFYPEERAESLVENTADTQERFQQLIDAGCKEIYLLSGTFSIQNNFKNLSLAGIDSPKVIIKAQTPMEFRKQEISLKDILPADEETKEILLHNDGLTAAASELLGILELYLQKEKQEERVC